MSTEERIQTIQARLRDVKDQGAAAQVQVLRMFVEDPEYVMEDVKQAMAREDINLYAMFHVNLEQ